MSYKFKALISGTVSQFFEREIKISAGMDDPEHVLWLRTLRAKFSLFLEEFHFMQKHESSHNQKLARKKFPPIK